MFLSIYGRCLLWRFCCWRPPGGCMKQKAEAGSALCLPAQTKWSETVRVCFLTSLRCFCCPSPQMFPRCSTTQLPCTAVIFRSCFNWRKSWHNVLLLNVFAIRILFTHPADLEICICMCLGSCFWLPEVWAHVTRILLCSLQTDKI